MTSKQQPEEGPRSFARFVENVADGELLDDASSALHKLTSTLRDTALYVNGKVKGELTLKLRMSIDPRGNVGLDFDVDTKLPKKKRAPAQAWISAGGNVVFEHPRQTKLPLREVGGKREIVDEETGEVRQVREV